MILAEQVLVALWSIFVIIAFFCLPVLQFYVVVFQGAAHGYELHFFQIPPNALVNWCLGGVFLGRDSACSHVGSQPPQSLLQEPVHVCALHPHSTRVEGAWSICDCPQVNAPVCGCQTSIGGRAANPCW